MDDLKRNNPRYPKQEIKLIVGVTPSINHMYVGKYRNTLTAKAKAYIQETQNICVAAMHLYDWKEERENVWYFMDLYFYFPDKRLRDSHNCIKLLLDSLQGVLFTNDYFVKPRIQDVELDRKFPRIEIIFHPETKRKK